MSISDKDEVLNDSTVEWDKLRNSTVLITGGTGFLGRALVGVLLRLNDTKKTNINVVLLCRSEKRAVDVFDGLINRHDLNFVYSDFSKSLKNIPKSDYIVHAASNASPSLYGIDPLGTSVPNVQGTYDLLSLANEWKSKSFLYISSGEVYGVVTSDQIPIKEHSYGYLDPLNVRSCYAESKRMGENFCKSFCHQMEVAAKIVRPFHTYGPGVALNDGRVFADFIANLVKNQDLIIKGSGNTRRAYCYLSDAIRAFFLVLLKGETGQAYNVGNPSQEASVLELATRLVSAFPDQGLRVRFEERDKDCKYLESPILRNLPDVSRLNGLGWVPKINIEEGFRRTVESFKELSKVSGRKA